MVGRWIALGGLGYINMLESELSAGAPFKTDDIANLATVSRRLAAVVARLQGQAVEQSGDVPGGASARRRAIRPR